MLSTQAATWLQALLFPTVYVLPLYLWRGPRNHPFIIRRRMITSLLITFGLQWIPVYLTLSKLGGKVRVFAGRTGPPIP